MASQQWYYRKGVARFGPVSSAEIKKMAAEGKLEPTDLLRGVGMTEWVPASKIKGLFPKTELESVSVSSTKSTLSQKTEVKPKIDDELGLAPLEPIQQEVAPAVKPTAKPLPQPAATTPVSKPASASNSNPNSARKLPSARSVPPSVTSPTAQPAPKTPTIPAAPQILAASNTANPFAQFGLEQTPPNDPFAIPNDPFATGIPALGNLDNLVALEKQGQTIYREPTVIAEPDPFSKKKETQSATQSDWVADLGPAGTVLTLLMPFMCMLILGYACGAIYALRMYIMGIMTYIMAMTFIFSMTSGVTKISGLFAGNCLLKLKIKNEVLALGYGALLGLFSLYVFMAGHIWMTINANPYRGMSVNKNNVQIREMDEDGRSLVLRPDEPTPFANPDFVPPAAEENVAENEGNENAENAENEKNGNEAEEKDGMANGEHGENEAEMNEESEITAEEPEEKQKNWEAEQMEMQESVERLMDIVDKFENGISIWASFSPLYVFLSFLPFGLLLWPINACILIFGTAHATWTSNLGYDPTKGGM
ncbi:MAG: GYF domain-containing protein [Planctomycetaceae bacterium]|nr:GYF domain-containing protein [Planctomycetaceae bacterium]